VRPRWPSAAAAVLLLLSLGAPAAAAPSRAGDDTPNFNESGGCGAWSMRPPLAGQSGFLGSLHQTYGPWADFFGRSYDQVRNSMVWWTVPMSGGQQVLVHARALPAFQQVTSNLADEAALGHFYSVKVAYGFTWRTVAGSVAMSHHAFGNAVDINPAQNPLTPGDRLVTDMPQWFVDAWTQAGFCWGGYWKSIKDPMHFSWEGPLATPGFGSRPTNYAPLTSADTFRERGAVAQTPFANASGWSVAVADRSGDGADDFYGVAPNGAATRVQVAGSVSDFGVIGMREDAPVTGTAFLVGDYRQTGRADLWVLDLTTPTIEISIYSDASDFQVRTAQLVTPVVMQAGTEFALADYDRDWRLDLFVIRRDGGGSMSVTVLNGATGFSTTFLHALTQLGVTTDPAWQFALGDYDLDAVPDLYAVRTSDGTVAVLRGGDGFAGAPIQMATSLPLGRTIAIGDHDGDGRDDLYAFDPGSGALEVLLGGRPPGGAPLTTWFQAPGLAPWDAGPECVGPQPCEQIGFVDQAARFFLKHDLSSDGGEDVFYYGNPGDVPLMGDWDCDGVDSPAMYRPTNGFMYLRNSNSQGFADLDYFYGNPSDLPLAGDFDGDGCDTLAIYRPSEGRVYVKNSLGTGFADYSYYFGNPGDKPFTGDFDGDGVDTVGLHRESTGFVYLRNSHTQGFADLAFYYGDPGDRLVAGDWNGDGLDSLVVYRPSQGDWYFKLANAQGVGDNAIRYYEGNPDKVLPVAGNFGTRR
jgi:hypothetical protein